MITTALFIASAAAPANAKEDWNHPMPKAWYVKLAQCETGNNTRHSTRSYVTAFGVYRRTWDNWNNTPNRKAHLLTFAQQARGVDRIAYKGHMEGGRFRYPVGLYGWGAIKNNCNGLNDDLCKSRHPLVIKIRRCK
jgi:hypothetical protein